MSILEELVRDYRTAFLRYLPRREEVALTIAYEIGRSAVEANVSILELARIHHDVLREVLSTSTPAEVTAIATGASEFFLEVLATYDMTQRAFRERD